MNFEQAMAEYARLRQGYESRQISGDEFGRQVQALRVQDASGTYWAIDGNTGGWLRYDGSNWVPGTPPIPQTPPLSQYGGYNAGATQVAPGGSGGFGGPPQQGGYGAQQGGFGAAPQQGGFGAPVQGGYGAPQPGMVAAPVAAKKGGASRPLLIGCGALVLLLICAGVAGVVAVRAGLLDSTTGLTEAETARTITSDKRPDEKATDFTASTQMYITYTARRVKKGETVDLKLFRDGTKVDLTGSQTTFEKDATYYGYYTYTPSQKGTYKAELYYNGEATPSKTLNFTVK